MTRNVPPPVDTQPTQVVETPVSSSLAERLVRQLQLLGVDDLSDMAQAVELVNLALLEARADHVLYDCAELTLTGVAPRFTGQDVVGSDSNGSMTLLGPLPPVGTLWIDPNGVKFFIASHRSP